MHLPLPCLRMRLGQADVICSYNSIQSVTHCLVIFWRLPRRIDCLCLVFGYHCQATCSVTLLLFPPHQRWSGLFFVLHPGDVQAQLWFLCHHDPHCFGVFLLLTLLLFADGFLVKAGTKRPWVLWLVPSSGRGNLSFSFHLSVFPAAAH